MVGLRRVLIPTAIACACACGRIGFGPCDDQPPPDAGSPGAITVSTLALTAGSPPLPGIVVWTNHADGSLHDSAMSGADGIAMLTVDPGGAVSAAYPGTPHRLRTVFGVDPGETFVFGGGAINCDMTPRGQVTVSWPEVPGATRYAFGTRCNQQSLPAPAVGLTWTVTGDVPDPFDLVIRAFGTTGETMRTATVLAAPTADGNTIAVGAEDWITPEPRTIGFSDIPAQFTQGDLVVTYRTPLSADSAGFDGVFVAPVTDGALVVGAGIPAGVERLMATMSVYNPSALDELTVGRPADAPFANDLVQAIDLPRLITSASYDLATRTGSWAELVPGEADAVIVDFAERDASQAALLVWTGVLPGSTTSMSFPDAPQGVVTRVPAAISLFGIQSYDLPGDPAWASLREPAASGTPFDFASDQPYARSRTSFDPGPIE